MVEIAQLDATPTPPPACLPKPRQALDGRELNARTGAVERALETLRAQEVRSRVRSQVRSRVTPAATISSMQRTAVNRDAPTLAPGETSGNPPNLREGTRGRVRVR